MNCRTFSPLFLNLRVCLNHPLTICLPLDVGLLWLRLLYHADFSSLESFPFLWNEHSIGDVLFLFFRSQILGSGIHATFFRATKRGTQTNRLHSKIPETFLLLRTTFARLQRQTLFWVKSSDLNWEGEVILIFSACALDFTISGDKQLHLLAKQFQDWLRWINAFSGLACFD